MRIGRQGLEEDDSVHSPRDQVSDKMHAHSSTKVPVDTNVIMSHIARSIRDSIYADDPRVSPAVTFTDAYRKKEAKNGITRRINTDHHS